MEVQTAQAHKLNRVCMNSVRNPVFKLYVVSYYLVKRTTDGHPSTVTSGVTVMEAELCPGCFHPTERAVWKPCAQQSACATLLWLQPSKKKSSICN